MRKGQCPPCGWAEHGCESTVGIRQEGASVRGLGPAKPSPLVGALFWPHPEAMQGPRGKGEAAAAGVVSLAYKEGLLGFDKVGAVHISCSQLICSAALGSG